MATQLVTGGLGVDGATVNMVTRGLGGFVSLGGGGMGLSFNPWLMLWRWFFKQTI